MLTSPELAKPFDDLIEQSFKYQLDNNLLPNFDNIDFAHLEKQNKNKILSLIHNLISKCPVNSDFEKKDNNEKIQSYMSDFLNENYPPMHPKTSMNIIGSIYQNAALNSLNPPLNKFFLFIEVSKLFYFFVQEKYIRKIKNMSNDLFLNHEFLTYSFNLIDGINVLLLSGNNNSVISVYRTFYENYIIFAFLQKYPALKTVFIEHKDMLHCLLIKEENNIKGIEVDNKILQRIDELEKKYGSGFKENYGWTESVIEDKSKRNLKTIYEASNLSEVFSFYYKLSCNFTHATSLALLCHPEVKDIYGYIYAIVEIFVREFEELLSNIKMVAKEKALFKEWIEYMARDVYKVLNDWYKIEHN